MKNLQIRDLPDWIYFLLKEKARQERRTLAKQAIACIEAGLNLFPDDKTRRQQLLLKIQTDTPVPWGDFDPVAMIREDRDR
jgi:hypothetical protein